MASNARASFAALANYILGIVLQHEALHSEARVGREPLAFRLGPQLLKRHPTLCQQQFLGLLLHRDQVHRPQCQHDDVPLRVALLLARRHRGSRGQVEAGTTHRALPLLARRPSRLVVLAELRQHGGIARGGEVARHVGRSVRPQEWRGAASTGDVGDRDRRAGGLAGALRERVRARRGHHAAALAQHLEGGRPHILRLGQRLRRIRAGPAVRGQRQRGLRHQGQPTAHLEDVRIDRRPSFEGRHQGADPRLRGRLAVRLRQHPLLRASRGQAHRLGRGGVGGQRGVELEVAGRDRARAGAAAVTALLVHGPLGAQPRRPRALAE
mmetsp:Transcript_46891/g.134051  ORF Transcript_46891/g.134051 Transcript_46891/m.134051 type:complete len:325 (-) Transcript_46891:134-1108(-)